MALDRIGTARRVIELLEGPLAAEGFDLLDVRVFIGGGRATLRIFLDTEGGMTVGACTKASRTAGMLLEEADPIEEAYVVEVSSPGIRRPLRTQAHFEAAVGENVILQLFPGRGPKSVKGRLSGMAGDVLSVEIADGESPIQVSVAHIREGNLNPDFDPRTLIQADRRQRKDDRRQVRETRRKDREGS